MCVMKHSFAGLSSSDPPWSLLPGNWNMFYSYSPDSSRKFSQSQGSDLNMLNQQ